ncbi:MAG: family 10 glycosylhydrolase [Thermoguttaceae bacterium]
MPWKNFTGPTVWLISAAILGAVAIGWCNPAAAAESELRGIWMWGSQVKSRTAADQCITQVDAAHLNAVFLLVWYWGGRTFYHSDLCPMANDIEPGYDPLAYMIEQCHRRGIQVHAWFVNGKCDSHLGHEVLERHPDWSIKNNDGRVAWYDFGKPDVRKFQSDLMIEVLKRYDVDGLHFDYIRYDHSPVICYCKRCQDEFSARYGFEPRYAPLPANAKTDPKKETLRMTKWAEYRKSTVSALVRDVYGRAKAAKPKAQITAAVFTPLATAEDLCQDWPNWLREGIIDFVVPMAYTSDDRELARQIDEWKTIDPQLDRIVPGLSIYKRTSKAMISREPQQVLAQYQLCLDRGAHGNVYFWYGNLSQAISQALVKRYYPSKVPVYRPPALR